MFWSYASHIPPAASLFAQAAQIIDRVFSPPPPPLRSKGGSEASRSFVQSVKQKSSRCRDYGFRCSIDLKSHCGLICSFHYKKTDYANGITFEKLDGRSNVCRRSFFLPFSLWILSSPLIDFFPSLFSSAWVWDVKLSGIFFLFLSKFIYEFYPFLANVSDVVLQNL